MRYVVTTLLFLSTFLMSANAQILQKPSVTFENFKHDFGKIVKSSPKRVATFKFRNDGSKPLIITDVSLSCGCISVDYTRLPVRPGKWGKVTVTYDGTNYPPGFFKKTIMLTTNGIPQYYQLFVTGELCR